MNLRVQQAGDEISAGAQARRRVLPGKLWGMLMRRVNVATLIGVLVLVYLNVPNYGNTINGALLPKYFYFAFACLLLPLFVQSKALASYLLSPFALWAFVFIVLNLIHLFGGVPAGDAVREQMIGMRIQYMLLTVLLGFAFSYARTASYERIFLFLALAAPLIVILDFMAPGWMYPAGTPGTVPGRGSATYINPTIAGEVILVTFLMACPLVKTQYRVPLLILAGVGVILTFSRSLIIAWMMLWVFLQAKRVLPRSALLFILAGVFAVPLLMAGFESYIGDRRDLAGAVSDLQSRLNFFTEMKLNDDSAQGRSAVLQAGWDLFRQYPVEGAGAGATHVWSYGLSTHNQMVLLAAEYGIAGIILWMAMAVLLWRGRYFEDRNLQISAVFLFVFLSMFTHNMLDMLHWLLFFALVAGRRRV